MLGWRMYQSEMCGGGCGYPRSVAHHPDNDGWFEVRDEDTVTCHACTALRRAQDNEGSKPVEPVEFAVVAYTRPNDQPLPTLAATGS